MGDRKHAPKRGAQNINNSLTNSPVKSVQSKIPKRNDIKEVKEEEKDENVKEMFEIIMSNYSFSFLLKALELMLHIIFIAN
jgi:hypothetical protein